ncbi:hypothetical protein A1O3_08874 [Capronia epimyces CBS 606.96]|uniref:Uncharacterized protein n=1 Tax=Capronia epimyces CBS 606.96 TaxID=1182542 RepID=W9XFW7_9EURO|nr:uncharacterized protein A1O3_08874 [Capronia epimyces CBS 606.96]EXJ79372.1 hypothetical protein A1O3_08874 [Capronia epimyces CBS 606.96]
MHTLTVDSLCQILGIKHPEDHPTCIGYGKAKPTCGNLASQQSRNTAVQIFQEVCHDLASGCNPSSLDASLEEAATLLHCKRWHRGQAPAMADKWLDRLVHYTTSRNRTPRRRSGRPRDPSTYRGIDTGHVARAETSTTTSYLSSARDEDLLAELLHRYQTLDQTLASIEALSNGLGTANRRTTHRRTSTRRTPPSETYHEPPDSYPATTTRSQEFDLREPYNADDVSLRSRPTTRSREGHRHSAPQPASSMPSPPTSTTRRSRTQSHPQPQPEDSSQIPGGRSRQSFFVLILILVLLILTLFLVLIHVFSQRTQAGIGAYNKIS